MDNKDLPPSLAEVADIIGREKALFLAGKFGGSGLYVPINADPTHRLAEILGQDSFQALVTEFRGVLLKIPTCAELERRHRDQSIIRLFLEGYSKDELAEMFKVNTRTIQSVTSPYNYTLRPCRPFSKIVFPIMRRPKQADFASVEQMILDISGANAVRMAQPTRQQNTHKPKRVTAQDTEPGAEQITLNFGD